MIRLLVPLLAIGLLHAEIRVAPIFGPETPTGRYKHAANICELSNGDLLLVYYGGEGEYAGGTAIFASRLKPGATKWTPPKQIARDPFHGVGNAAAWQAPDGKLWLFYSIRFGETWSTSRAAAKVSEDLGETWSDTSLLSPDEGWMVRGKPILLDSGKYLLPLYHETGSAREIVPPDTTSFFLIYDPKTKAWTRSASIRSRLGNLQPSPAEIAPRHIIAYCRRGGGYDGAKDGWTVRGESRDGGMTWTATEDHRFPNPNSAVEFLKLRSGALLLIFNDSMRERTPLTAALSTDQDKSYPNRVDIQKGKNSFAYPSAVQSRDGKIHVVYTTNERSVIQYAVFEESDVRSVR